MAIHIKDMQKKGNFAAIIRSESYYRKPMSYIQLLLPIEQEKLLIAYETGANKTRPRQ